MKLRQRSKAMKADYKTVIALSHERCKKLGIKEDMVYSSRILTRPSSRKNSQKAGI
jgi:hypothetical protein